MTNEEAFEIFLKRCKTFEPVIQAAEIIRMVGVEGAINNTMEAYGSNDPLLRIFLGQVYTHLSELDKEANQHLFN